MNSKRYPLSLPRPQSLHHDLNLSRESILTQRRVQPFGDNLVVVFFIHSGRYYSPHRREEAKCLFLS
jgi:hypothetical protein